MRALWCLLLLPLAGCLGDSGPDETEPAGGMVAAAGTILHDASGCQLVAALIPAQPDTLAAHLPDGFTPADASGLLGTPDTGLGAALATGYACSDSAWTQADLVGAEVNILVEDPGLPTGEAGDASTHYYLAEFNLDDGPIRDRMEADGWTLGPGAGISVEVTDLSAAWLGTTNNGAYAVTMAGAADNPFAGVSRFWHETPGGASWFDYAIDTTAKAGPGVLTPSGGLVAELAGPLPVSVNVAFAVADFAWNATYYPPGYA